MNTHPSHDRDPLYDTVAQRSAALVISAYSSSFGLASRLLPRPLRAHIANLYALVRLADEIVDQPPSPSAIPARSRALDELQAQTHRVLAEGHSTNLVVHAFGITANDCGIDSSLIDPFFTSMRMDLHLVTNTPETFAEYVYGSAEVVGLMCLRAFLRHEDPHGDFQARYAALTPGARALGAAFQKVNFLRDLADDHGRLGRSYFPGLDPNELTEADKQQLVDDIDTDLATAASAIPELPTSSRRAVLAAHATFAELSALLRRTPASTIRTTRVRVPAYVKVRRVTRALLEGPR